MKEKDEQSSRRQPAIALVREEEEGNRDRQQRVELETAISSGRRMRPVYKTLKKTPDLEFVKRTN
jgi:hypothetical protein